MNCEVHAAIQQKGKGVQVNGVAIARDDIVREIQQHPSRTPIDAWKSAAQALVVRELLLQEARRLGVPCKPFDDSKGRRETDEDAVIRALIAQEVRTPQADKEVCRRYYEKNLQLFKSQEIYEAAHILFAAVKSNAEGYAQARIEAKAVLVDLRRQPERFGEFARALSTCPSAAHDGNLGQITRAQVTPEFGRALAALVPGAITLEPIATRYGFHIIRLDRRIDGRILPFEVVAERVDEFLTQSAERRAIAQYIAHLVSRAEILGIELANAQAHRTN